MSSKMSTSNLEERSEGDRAAQQEDANSSKSPLPGPNVVDPHNEADPASRDATQSPPQCDPPQNVQQQAKYSGDIPIPKLSDPLTTHVPKPDGDPFEVLLKPMLERDAIQCDAWKDEVQNTLIFAGLFSAVVTAFIIESYQRLQPDPNDTIVGLLAHIAERLDNVSVNNSSSSIFAVDTAFSPSRSDVNINVFWFISLILSLTAALIGIITLQWLREHQRYDTTQTARIRMAIFNARAHSLKNWFGPEIFAALPLLLQAALALFFAGMVEFLFSLRLEVALAVTVVISIPLIFLIATTILPLLQLCIIRDPFRLSINNHVPSPCPYKSPQSLIGRRIGTISPLVFKCFTLVLTSAYLCAVQVFCAVRKILGQPLPIYRTQTSGAEHNLPVDTDGFWDSDNIYETSGNWTSVDLYWLQVRTTYAVFLQTENRRDSDSPKNLSIPRQFPILRPDIYDCTNRFHAILAHGRSGSEDHALYHCIQDSCVDTMAILQKLWSGCPWTPEYTDACIILGQFVCNDYDSLVASPWAPGHITITTQLVESVVAVETPDLDAKHAGLDNLTTLLMSFWLSSRYHGSTLDVKAVIKSTSVQTLANRLTLAPDQLFAMDTSAMWLPYNVIGSLVYWSLDNKVTRHFPLATKFLRLFVDACEGTEPSQTGHLLRPAPASDNYGGVGAYMGVLVDMQTDDEIHDTLVHFIDLCDHAQVNLLDHPFLTLATAFYLRELGCQRRYQLLQTAANERQILQAKIFNACGISNSGDDDMEQEELDQVINSVYNYHHSAQLRTESGNPHIGTIGDDENV